MTSPKLCDWTAPFNRGSFPDLTRRAASSTDDDQPECARIEMLRPLTSWLTRSDFARLDHLLGNGKILIPLLGRLLRTKLADAQILHDRMDKSRHAASGDVISYSINGGAPRMALLQAEGNMAPPEFETLKKIELNGFTGLTVIGLEVEGRAPLLSENGAISYITLHQIYRPIGHVPSSASATPKEREAHND